MNPPIISPEILMDEEEFAETELTVDELRSCQKTMGGKYHDFFLIPKVDDE